MVDIVDDRHSLSPTQLEPEKFVDLMKLMEHRYGGKDFVTNKDTSLLAPGTYYLTEVDSKYRRFYAKKAIVNGTIANGHWRYSSLPDHNVMPWSWLACLVKFST